MSEPRRAVVLLGVVLLAACSGKQGSFGTIDDPGKVSTVPQLTTSTEVALNGVPLNPVAGNTTTSVVLGPGPVTIAGTVQAPDGVVPDAVVQLERLVGDGVATTRIATLPDGTWKLEKVLGGRYRIRAWRVPDLATAKPEVLFIEEGSDKPVALTLAAVGGVRVDAAIAPDPPVVGNQANIEVRVAERTVDAEGVVRDTPRESVSVGLGGSGAWELDSPSPTTTATDGTAEFRVTCQQSGQQPLFATLADGTSYALLLPACASPATTTTSTTERSSTTSTSRPRTTTTRRSTTTTTEA
jgi:hypothetical protein